LVSGTYTIAAYREVEAAAAVGVNFIMSEKYAGLIGRFHLWKESARERWAAVKETGGLGDTVRQKTSDITEGVITKMNHGEDGKEDEYGHLYR
jgi:hypothetical protein